MVEKDKELNIRKQYINKRKIFMIVLVLAVLFYSQNTFSDISQYNFSNELRGNQSYGWDDSLNKDFGNWTRDPNIGTWNAFTEGDYNKSEYYDSESAESSALLAEFREHFTVWYNITENPATITKLNITLHAKSDLGTDGFETFIYYNLTNGSWIWLEYNSTGSSSNWFNQTIIIDSDVDRYIIANETNATWVKVMIQSLDDNPGGTCPFVYAYNGTDYTFEHEAFPQSLISSLERTSYDKLWSLEEFNETYKIRIAEEISEISFIRNVSLYVIDRPNNTMIFPEWNTGDIYSLFDEANLKGCEDRDGNDCSKFIKEEDNIVYRQEPYVEIRDDYEDWLEFEYEKPEKIENAWFHFTAIADKPLPNFYNEGFISKVGNNNWEKTQTLLNLPFFRNLFVEKLKDEINIKVDVFDGEKWRVVDYFRIGEFKEEDLLVKINLKSIGLNYTKLRIRNMRGGYMIDSANLYYGSSDDIKINEIRPSKFVYNEEEDISYKIGSDIVEIPYGDYLDIDFKAVPKMEGYERDYVIGVTGYYNPIIENNVSSLQFVKNIKGIVELLLSDNGVGDFVAKNTHKTTYLDYAAMDVTFTNVGCGDTITSNLTMAYNLTDCTGRGLTIGANDITLDCNGFEIDGDDDDDGEYGILASGRTGTTIKNCVIKEHSRGIYFGSDTTGTIHDNDIFSNWDYGIYMSYDDIGLITVENNSIHNVSGGDGRGVYIYRNMENVTFKNNTIYENSNYGLRSEGSFSSGGNWNITFVNNTFFRNLGAGVGLYLSVTSNSTIEGNTIYDNIGDGVYLINAENVTILNNSIYNTNGGVANPQDYGIRAANTNKSYFANNLIMNHSSSDQGLRINDVNGNNNVIHNNTFLNNFYSVWIQGGSWNNITYNVVNTTDASSARAFTTENSAGSDYNIFTNNEIHFLTSLGSAYAFYLRYCNNCSVIDHNFVGYSTGDGTLNPRNSQGINVTNYTSIGATYYGLYLASAHNGTYKDINVSTSSYSYGTYLSLSNDNTFEDLYSSSTTYPIYSSTSGYNKFIDSSARGAPTYSFRFAGTSAVGWVELLNFSRDNKRFLWSSGSNEVIHKWYLDAMTNLSDGSNLEGANISVYNVSGDWILENLTNSSGWIPRKNLTSYYENRTNGHYFVQNNYTINSSEGTYGDAFRIINLSDNMVVNLTYVVAGNSAPDDPSPLLTSVGGDTNYTTQALNCSATITDTDGDALNVSLKWYKNNLLHSSPDYNNSYSSGSNFNETLGSTNTTVGDFWFCSMQLYDGQENSSWKNSSSLIILDPDYSGPIYYVSRDGSDSNGGTSWLDSWLTIEQADTSAAAHSLTYVGDGLYTENSSNLGYLYLNGNIANRTYKAFNQSQVTINGTTSDTSRVIRFNTQSNNATFVGFVFEGNQIKFRAVGKITNPGYSILINNTFQGSTSLGVAVEDKSNWIIKNNKFINTNYGVYSGNPSTDVENVTIDGNNFSATLGERPLRFDRSTNEIENVLITNNNINYNDSVTPYGIYLNNINGSSWNITNNVFGTPEEPIMNLSINGINTTDLEINNNTFWTNNSGSSSIRFTTGENSNLKIYHNRWGNSTNDINSAGQYLVDLTNSSSSIIENNLFFLVDGHGILLRTFTSGITTQNVIIRGNNFTHSEVPNRYSISVGADTSSDAYASINNTLIERNRIIMPEESTSKHAIFTGFTYNTTLRDNYIFGGGYGVVSKHDNWYYYYNNTNENHSDYEALLIKATNNSFIYNNTFFCPNRYSSARCIEFKDGDAPLSWTVENSTVYNNTFHLYNGTLAYETAGSSTNFTDMNLISDNNTFILNQSTQDISEDFILYTLREGWDALGLESKSILSATSEIPVIYNRVNINSTTTSRINWSTQESTNSTLEYGLTISLGSSIMDVVFLLNHSILLSSLSPGAFYYYNLTSCDFENNCNTSGLHNFTTAVLNNAPVTTTPVLNASSTNNYTADDLYCYFTVTDDDSGDTLFGNYTWYKDDVINLTGQISVVNDTEINVSLGNGNTTRLQNWKCEITPYDETDYGTAKNSTNLTILNSPPPALTNVILNTSSNNNLSTENLTLYFDTNSDDDEDLVYNITDWRINGTSMAVLNMPFDSNISIVNASIRDYTTFGNNGTLGNVTATTQPTYNSPSSCVKGGCYHFDGDDDHIQLYNNINISNGGTVMGWMKFDHLLSDQQLVGFGKPGEEEFSLWMDENGESDRFGVAIYDGSWGAEYGTIALNESWWHVTFRYVDNGTSDYAQLYVNGVQDGSNLDATITDFDGDWRIGIGDNGAKQHTGFIDEVKIFNISLSPEQIYKEYLSGYKNLSTLEIISNETSVGENWTVEVTPNDLLSDGPGVLSNGIVILNGIPSVPVLIVPTTGNTTYRDRTPFFNWTNSSDPDGDSITYRVAVANDIDLTSVVFNVSSAESGTASYYNHTTNLDTDSILYWRVDAITDDYVSFSEIWNFTIESYLDMTLNTKEVAFGSLSIGDTDNTTDNNPPPIEIENQGNVLMHINLSATQLFSTVALDNDSFQFKVDNTSEGTSFNLTDSLTSWTNVPTGMITAIYGFEFSDVNDTAVCDFNLTVPMTETPSDIFSDITFTSIFGE
jgi:parallel beta-helix repeat protein